MKHTSERSDLGFRAANVAGFLMRGISAIADIGKNVRKIVGSENFEIRTVSVRTIPKLNFQRIFLLLTHMFASLHLYMRLCPSVGPSIRPSVGRSVGRLVV